MQKSKKSTIKKARKKHRRFKSLDSPGDSLFETPEQKYQTRLEQQDRKIDDLSAKIEKLTDLLLETTKKKKSKIHVSCWISCC